MKIVSVVGARPNFVKIAPLLREMRCQSWIMPMLVHTGQHYDQAMSAQFFRDLEIEPPEVNLGVGSASHAAQTAEVMRRLEPVLEATRRDLMVVVGDVTSTLGAAPPAAKLGVPVAHVEAGLRSFDRRMPEEINRLLTDAIADLLFVTEESGQENLLREGVAPQKIHCVGNVMIDALELFRPRWAQSAIFDVIKLSPERPYAVVTLHRPSNVDDPGMLSGFMAAFGALAAHLPVIFPVHPRVSSRLRGGEGGQGTRPAGDRTITFFSPMSHLHLIPFLHPPPPLPSDFGGAQERTTTPGLPVLPPPDTPGR